MVMNGGSSCLVEAGRLHSQKSLSEEQISGCKRGKKRHVLMWRDMNDSDKRLPLS